MAQPKWLREIEAAILGVGIAAMKSNETMAVAEIEAAAAAAQGSKSQANVNAAVEKFVPVFFRSALDAELQAQEASGASALAAGAPAFFDHVVSVLEGLQAKLKA